MGLFDLGAYLVGKEMFGESVIIHREPVETTSSPKEEVILGCHHVNIDAVTMYLNI